MRLITFTAILGCFSIANSQASLCFSDFQNRAMQVAQDCFSSLSSGCDCYDKGFKKEFDSIADCQNPDPAVQQFAYRIAFVSSMRYMIAQSVTPAGCDQPADWMQQTGMSECEVALAQTVPVNGNPYVPACSWTKASDSCSTNPFDAAAWSSGVDEVLSGCDMLQCDAAVVNMNCKAITYLEGTLANARCAEKCPEIETLGMVATETPTPRPVPLPPPRVPPVPAPGSSPAVPAPPNSTVPAPRAPPVPVPVPKRVSVAPSYAPPVNGRSLSSTGLIAAIVAPIVILIFVGVSIGATVLYKRYMSTAALGSPSKTQAAISVHDVSWSPPPGVSEVPRQLP